MSRRSRAAAAQTIAPVDVPQRRYTPEQLELVTWLVRGVIEKRMREAAATVPDRHPPVRVAGARKR